MSGKYALIIGNTEYADPGLSQLSAPGKDANDFARVLKDKDVCAFDKVEVLLNQPEHIVRRAIDDFLDQKKPDDLLVLYFSGHGVRDEVGALYLAVKNTNRFRLRSTAVKSDYIRDAMDQSRSRRQVLILDCCNSGAFAQGTKAATGVSIGTASAFEGGYGRIILTASDSTQFAWEGDKVIGETDNSLFTHFLVEGLGGDADIDGDGCITVDELYDYTYEKVKLATPKQTPSKFSSKQQGEILLRDNIRIEDKKPAPLPDDLVAAMNNSLPYIREGAVSQLELLLKGKNLNLARSASIALERMVNEDDSRRVAQAALKALESAGQIDKKDGTKTMKDGSTTASQTGQLRREKLEQEVRFKAEQTKQLKEKEELEKRLKEQGETVKKTEGLPVRAKSWLIPIGLVAIVSIILVGGYLIRGFLAASSNPATTEAPSVIHTPSETPAPPTEPPTNVPEPTDSETSNPAIPPTEIIDDRGVAMVLVPAGNFTMGSDTGDSDEKPIHTIYLDSYYIDKFEVTNSNYEACVTDRVCIPPLNSGSYTRSSYYGYSQFNDYPVVYVNWNMAKTYCEWRGAKLPTEAQWEKAARGTDSRTYPWGREIDCQKANYQGSGNGCAGGTSRVGSYPGGVSPYGVYDMAGNVWEWVADRYSEVYYQSSLPSNPLGPDFGQSRVLKGGSWNRSEYDNRVSNRLKYAPDYNNFDIGFRCANPIETEGPGIVDQEEEMILIPSGNFSMGSSNGDSDEKPIHSIYLDEYYIDKYEVTNARYKACVNSRVCIPPLNSGSYTRTSYYGNSQYDDYPVVYVDWNMAKTYCEWRDARLPTEAEWEKAARGTDSRTYPWGRDIDCQKANYYGGDNGCVGGTSKVGIYDAGISPYGLYDMAGNVWEWVADRYSSIYYASSPRSNPLGPDLGQSRVLRSGSWNRGEYDNRISNRLKYDPDYNNFDIGFRCARSTP